ncbi:hypothetical protein NECID01_1881 [Nematocida sp. AWRm77]|nr:hypothetical protein NECID01_1881 [Nematocida sp. AWRm77]
MLDDILMRLKRQKTGSSSESASQKGPFPKEEVLLSTQAPPISPGAKLLEARETFGGELQVRISEILDGEGLRVQGVVIGTVSQVLVQGAVTHLCIADETSEIFCSVHPDTKKDASVKKDAVIVIDSPAVWRVPYAKYTPVLNITQKNLLYLGGA